MSSINYVTTLSTALIGLMSAGIGFRCVQILLTAMSDGEDFHVAINKIKKKLAALIFLVCTGSLIAIIEQYYM